MQIDKELIDAILKQADIVKIISSYLTVTKRGRNYFAVCPFHDDTNPSLTISPEKKIFKCFVCGTSGNAITFVSKYEHIPFMEAVRKVAELSDFHDPRLEKNTYVKKVDAQTENLYKCLTDLTLYYQFALGTPEGKEGLEYFEDRKLDAQMRSKYRLGYAFKDGKATCKFLLDKGHSTKTIEDIGIAYITNGEQKDKNQGRVIFPICDKDGNVIGFSARRLKDGPEAKYVNSPETKLFHKSSVLYNYHIAKERCKIDGFVYVVEGFMDVFALAKIGIDSAVALMGTALTVEHISMLRALNVEVRLCLDGDLPGQTAMMEASKLLAKNGIKTRIVDNQGSTKDADEILNTEGPDALRMYLNTLLDRIDFVLNYYRRSNPLKTAEQKKKLVENFIPVLINVNDRLLLDSYIRKLAQITGFEFESIMSLLEEVRQSSNKDVEKIFNKFRPERKALRKLENAERELLYQMLHNPSALAFYEENDMHFFEPVHRKIAEYLMEYKKEHADLDQAMMLNFLEINDYPDKDEISEEISMIMFEDNHLNKCNDKLLTDLKASIDDEMQKMYEKSTLDMVIQDKSPLDQARIIADYIRRNKKM